jgi:hypothetical protein
VEQEFCELRLYRILRSKQHLAAHKQSKDHSFAGCALR